MNLGRILQMFLPLNLSSATIKQQDNQSKITYDDTLHDSFELNNSIQQLLNKISTIESKLFQQLQQIPDGLRSDIDNILNNRLIKPENIAKGLTFIVQNFKKSSNDLNDIMRLIKVTLDLKNDDISMNLTTSLMLQQEIENYCSNNGYQYLKACELLLNDPDVQNSDFLIKMFSKLESNFSQQQSTELNLLLNKMAENSYNKKFAFLNPSQQIILKAKLYFGCKYINCSIDDLNNAKSVLRKLNGTLQQDSSNKILNTPAQPEAVFSQAFLLNFDNINKPYPVFLHVFREKGNRPTSDQPELEDIWLRFTIMTFYLGDVNVVFRYYQNNNLDIQLTFSNRELNLNNDKIIYEMKDICKANNFTLQTIFVK